MDRLVSQVRALVGSGRATEPQVAGWVRLVAQGKALPEQLAPDDADVVRRLAWLMLCHAPALDSGWLVMATMRCELIAAGASSWDEAFDDVRLLEEITPHDGAAIERVLALGGDLLRAHVARELDATRSGQRRPPSGAPPGDPDDTDDPGDTGDTGVTGDTGDTGDTGVTPPAATPSGPPPLTIASRPAASEPPPRPAADPAATAYYFLPRGVSRERFVQRAAESRLRWRDAPTPGRGAPAELRFVTDDGLDLTFRELPLLDVAGVRVASRVVDPAHPVLVSLGAIPYDAWLAAPLPARDHEASLHWVACAALAGPALADEVARERLAAALLGAAPELRFTAALVAVVGGWAAGRELAAARLPTERDARVRGALGRVLGRRDEELETALARWQQQPLPVWSGVLPDGDEGLGATAVSRRDLDRLLFSLELRLLQWNAATATTRHEKQWLTADGRALVRYREEAAPGLRVVQVEGPRATALGAALVAGLGLVDAAAALRRARAARGSREAQRSLREIAAVAPAIEDPALVSAVDVLATHPDPEVRLAALLPIARHHWPGYLQPLARLLADGGDPRVAEAARLVATERMSHGAPWPAFVPPPITPPPRWPEANAPQVVIAERGVGAPAVLDALAGYVFRSATPVPGHPGLYSEVTFTSRDGETRVVVRQSSLIGVVALTVTGERAGAAVRELGRHVALVAPEAVRPRARAGRPDDRAWALRALGATAGRRYHLGVFQLLAAALEDPSPDIRLAAVDAVATGAAWRELRPPLQRLLRTERDQTVVEATRGALRVLARQR